MNQRINKDALAHTIVRLVRDRKPRNVKHLVDLAKTETALPEDKIIKLVLQLQKDGKITLRAPPPTPSQKLGTYLRTKDTYWYWTIVLLEIATTLTVLTGPEDAYPFMYLRYILGAIFVLWLPGYSFIRALFPQNVQAKKTLDTEERIALSLGMSLVLVSIVGLLLNYTPWGIRLMPIVLSLVFLTTIFATAAIAIESRHRLRKETA